MESKTSIMGYNVLFPSDRKPFPPQIAVMSKVLLALNKSDNALLESPTGTGKTLALLTSSLCWQKSLKDKLSACNSQSLSHNSDNGITSSNTTSNVNSKQSKINKIIFSSRTHTQLNQVIKEIRNLHPDYTENLNMSILSSRNNSCINEKVKQQSIDGKKNLDENCRDLSKRMGCFYNSSNRIENVIDNLKKLHVWDIEDAAIIGKKHKGCPYYSSRQMINDANLILAPYNFILDSSIRKTVGLDLTDSIVIFDEAHNIEEVARSVNSLELNHFTILQSIHQLERLLEAGSVAFKLLLKFLKDIYEWFIEMIDNISHQQISSFGSNNNTKSIPIRDIWDGEEILDVFSKRFGFNESIYNIYVQHFQTIINEQDDIINILNTSDYTNDNNENNTQSIELEAEKLDNMTIIILKSLFHIIGILFSNNHENATNFQFVIQKNKFSNIKKRKFSNNVITSSYDEYNLNIWCLNASVAFKEIDLLCHSILLSSGTLSPMNSFVSELGIEFPIYVEANHIIDINKQVNIFAIKSIQNNIFNFTYSNQDNYDLIDGLGITLDTISKITPGGLLMFFSSYSMMEKVYQRWDQTGLIYNITGKNSSDMNNNINQDSSQNPFKIPIFLEPRETKLIDNILSDYYEAINSYNGRAILLAVCRGKVSEGIDFSNDYARTVIIVGIPFPSITDRLTLLKKEYLNKQMKLSKSVLDGNQWYNQQAYRAINQAIGRCIRHKFDYGAILLLDYRYHNDNTKSNISKWLKSSIVNYNSIEETIIPLQCFFKSNVNILNNQRYNEYYNTSQELMNQKISNQIKKLNHSIDSSIITSRKITSMINNRTDTKVTIPNGTSRKVEIKKDKIEEFAIFKAFQKTKKNDDMNISK